MNMKIKSILLALFLFILVFGITILSIFLPNDKQESNEIAEVIQGPFFLNLPDNIKKDFSSVKNNGPNSADFQRPSIMLITIDTLRSDALGCYGAANAETPAIDELAQNGILFENVMCQAPATGPSFSSMITSKYPSECGVLHNTMVLNEEQTTMAEVFKNAGYHTAGFVSCTILKSEYGFSQGFDVFDENFETHYSKMDLERSAESTTTAVLNWLKNQKNQDFFLWIHYFDPHAPYKNHQNLLIQNKYGTNEFLMEFEKNWSSIETPKRKSGIDMVRKLYDGEVSYVDKHIGLLMNMLETIDARKNTIVILAADHGEELFDHGAFHGHYLSLFQSVLNTPLVISYPAALPKGAKISGLVENMDIFPTLLALTKTPLPQGIRGMNLLSGIQNPAILNYRITYAQREPYEWMPGGEGVAMRHEDWKYIYFSNRKNMLFNLNKDPLESQNLSDQNENIRLILDKKLSQWFDACAPKRSRPIRKKDISPQNLDKLKSLGYTK